MRQSPERKLELLARELVRERDVAGLLATSDEAEERELPELSAWCRMRAAGGGGLRRKPHPERGWQEWCWALPGGAEVKPLFGGNWSVCLEVYPEGRSALPPGRPGAMVGRYGGTFYFYECRRWFGPYLNAWLRPRTRPLGGARVEELRAIVLAAARAALSVSGPAG